MRFDGMSFLAHLSRAPKGRWKLWALAAVVTLLAGIGTWFTGQYQIGRLDSLKNNYDTPVANFAKNIGNAPVKSLEWELLDDCKQAQIGSWLQTTDALRFDGPLTGNRIDVRLDGSKAYLDLNGKEISSCIQDEVESRQFDIGSLTNTWAILLLLLSFCLGIWSWICFIGTTRARSSKDIHAEDDRPRNVYAETLAETTATAPVESQQEDKSAEENPQAPAPKPEADLT